MELSRVIVKPFSEAEIKQIIKDLALFSKFLLETHLFLSLGIGFFELNFKLKKS